MSKLNNTIKYLAPLFAMLVTSSPATPAKDSNCCTEKGANGSAACAKAKEGKAETTSCSTNCESCAKTCEKTLNYFLKKGGKYTEAANIRTLKDCVALCKASADFHARGSAHATKVAALCHDLCLECAKMCKDMNDPKLADCIKSCEECADCCAKS